MKPEEQKKLSEMFSDMVFLNDQLGGRVGAVEAEFEEFKRSIIVSLNEQLALMNRRIMLLENGEKPTRSYIIERE